MPNYFGSRFFRRWCGAVCIGVYALMVASLTRADAPHQAAPTSLGDVLPLTRQEVKVLVPIINPHWKKHQQLRELAEANGWPMPEATVEDVLERALRDLLADDAQIRQRAVKEIISNSARSELMDVLIKVALYDPDPQVRMIAMTGIAEDHPHRKALVVSTVLLQPDSVSYEVFKEFAEICKDNEPMLMLVLRRGVENPALDVGSDQIVMRLLNNYSTSRPTNGNMLARQFDAKKRPADDVIETLESVLKDARRRQRLGVLGMIDSEPLENALSVWTGKDYVDEARTAFHSEDLPARRHEQFGDPSAPNPFTAPFPKLIAPPPPQAPFIPDKEEEENDDEEAPQGNDDNPFGAGDINPFG